MHTLAVTVCKCVEGERAGARLRRAFESRTVHTHQTVQCTLICMFLWALACSDTKTLGHSVWLGNVSVCNVNHTRWTQTQPRVLQREPLNVSSASAISRLLTMQIKHFYLNPVVRNICVNWVTLWLWNDILHHSDCFKSPSGIIWTGLIVG